MRAIVVFLFIIYLLPPSLQAARLELRQAGTDVVQPSVLVGKELEVELWVDSEGQQLSGAAIFLSFDDTVFELVSQDQAVTTTPVQPFTTGWFLKNGEIFRNDLLAPDDPAATASGTQLDYSVVRAADQGRGPVATFRLRARVPSRESVVRIDESGIRETRVFLPDGTQRAFRFITPLRVVVQGITLADLPEQLVLPRGAVDETTFRLDDLVFDPLYRPEEITWSLSPAPSLSITRQPGTNILRIAAPVDDSPWEQLILTATNPDGQSVADTVEVFVVAPPRLAPPEPVVFSEDESFALQLAELVEDPDTPAAQLRWTAAGSADLQVLIDGTPAVARLIPQADWNGTGAVVLMVADDFGFADTTRVEVVVEPVNDPPRLLWSPNVRLTDGRQDSSIVIADLIADTENDPLSLTWSAAGQIQVEERHGRLVLANRDGWTGTQQIRLQVADSGGLSATAPLTVTVVPSLPPSFIDPPQRQGMPAGGHFVLALDDLAIDPDDPAADLSWKISGQQQLRVQLSSGRSARVEAPADFAGTETLTFRVADPTGAAASFDLLVFAAPLSGAPLLAPMPEVSLPVDGVDASLDLDDFVFDLDHPATAMEFFVPARDDLELHVDLLTHLLTIAPTEQARPGSLELELRVADPDGNEAVQTLRIRLTGGPQTPPFALTPIPPIEILSGQPYTLDLDDYLSGQVDPDQIQWTVEGQQHLAGAVDPQTRQLVLSAPADWTGSESLVIVAVYGDLSPLRQSFVVTAILLPPSLAPFPQLSLPAGQEERLDLDDYVDHLDPALLTWTVDGQRHLRAQVEATTRQLHLTADPDWLGQEVLILTGYDPAGHRLEGVLRIDITAPPSSLELRQTTQVPLFAGATEIRLDPTDLLVTGGDPATLVWEAEGTRPLIVLYDPAEAVLIIKPETPWQQSDIITLRVRDLKANEATGHLLAQVYPTDGSAGRISPDFQLAVVPHPLQPEYVDLFVLASASLPHPPLLRLQDGTWHDLTLAPHAPGLWQGNHALPPGQQGQIEIIALAIDVDQQVLKSSFILELIKPAGPRAKPVSGGAGGFAE